MSFDASTHRRESLEGWEAAAPGWARIQGQLRLFAAPVSQWMIEAVSPQPGERLLELAAGMGETGLLAAELVAPAGSVLISDQAEAMLDGARARAQELGVRNVEFRALNAESLDLPLASFDAALCRWGYMLMADPVTALTETRRVLRPGGRLALAVWDSIAANPWAALPAQELAERSATGGPGAAQGPAGAPAPGPFALGDPALVERMLEDAGFADIHVEGLDLRRDHIGFDELWETMLDISRSFHDAVMERPAAEIEQIRASIERRFEPYTAGDGSLSIPARTLVARASA